MTEPAAAAPEGADGPEGSAGADGPDGAVGPDEPYGAAGASESPGGVGVPRRRPSSAKRSLGSIVLGFETVVMFLAALVAFGLNALPPLLALGGGALLCLALVAAAGLLAYRAGYVLGWILQGAILASAFLVPVMGIVGVIFVALWSYCMITGARLDREKAAFEASQ